VIQRVEWAVTEVGTDRQGRQVEGLDIGEGRESGEIRTDVAVI